MTKNFRLSAADIMPLATGHGGCIASNMITVDGRPVGFFYRQKPDNHIDSGWRFLTGFEDDAYMADDDNHAIYDVNTIANYDPSIIPLLDAPIGSVFERDEETSQFLVVDDWAVPQ